MSDITILDGGMGQELIARSKNEPTPLWSAQVMLDEPDLVRDIHRDYFAAGAQIATTNTYSCMRDRLEPVEKAHLLEELQMKACELASQARDLNGAGMIAGALGPLGWSYRPELAPDPEIAAEQYAEIVKIQEPLVDFHIAETMSSVDQAKGAMMGASVSAKPTWLAISVKDDDGTHLRSGEPVTEIQSVVDEYAPAALLVNCATPEAISQTIPLLKGCGIPFGAYANGFTFISPEFKQAVTVDRLEKRQDLNPEKYADFCDQWIKGGATIVGGCCEVGPAHITEIKRRFH